ncbi:EamA family transporter [Candidatus Dependentiae bacterium]|nr:EamA family transporter [Candidatus Dependentiae bacterium]
MWLPYALLSAFCTALVAVFAKLGLHSIEPLKGITLGSIIITIFFLLLGFYLQGTNIFNIRGWEFKDWLLFSSSVVAGSLSWLFYFKALTQSTPSHVQAISMLSLVFIIALSSYVFNEHVTAKTMFGAVLMFVGAFLMVIK